MKKEKLTELKIDTVSVVLNDGIKLPSLGDLFTIQGQELREIYKKTLSKFEPLIWDISRESWNIDIRDYDIVFGNPAYLPVELSKNKKAEDAPSKYISRKQVPNPVNSSKKKIIKRKKR